MRFRRNKSAEQGSTTSIEAVTAPEIQTNKLKTVKSEVAGFVVTQSGILRPEEGTHVKVSGGTENQPFTLVTDKRRVTPESVEAAHQERMEALRAPLTGKEIIAVTAYAQAELKSKANQLTSGRKRGETVNEVVVGDLNGDLGAFGRLNQLVAGGIIARGNDASNIAKGMTARERITDLVSLYSSMQGGTEAQQRYRASNGGDVQIDPVTNEVHSSGYNNGLLYEFARTGQIMDKLDQNPQLARETLASEQPDFGWLTAEPVVVRPIQVAQANT